MKKIGILTFHFVFNNGAVLQCLALQKALKKLAGDKVEISVIDYQPYYHTNMYNVIINPFYSAYHLACSFKDRGMLYQIYRFLRNICSNIAKNVNFLTRYKRKKIFKTYIDKHIPVSKLYKTEQELKEDSESYQAYVVGSDQIWNSKITNYAIDPVYYLGFLPDSSNALKYAYAASANFLEKEVEQIYQYIKSFDGISVREQTAYKWLQEKELTQSRLDIDPTLLLEKQEFAEFEEAIDGLPEDYIVFYGLEMKDNRNLKEALMEVQNKLQMPIVDISPIDNKIEGETIRYCVSPGQFLYCIKNAKYVVTNSFHGSVFSIIYEKLFRVVMPNLHSERLSQLLEIYELQGRLSSNIEEKIDWEKTKEIHLRERTRSLEYLKEIVDHVYCD